MRNCNVTDSHGVNYRRISKPLARKMYADGAKIIICPSNLRPFTPHGFTGEIAKNRDFDAVINEHEFYCCNCNETGRYTAFYTPVAN